jgi:nucleoside 2-deoxyribosyltransferase
MVKKAATKQERGNGEDSTPKTGKKPRRSFPIATLEDALKIPLAIKTKNSGNPLESKLVAKACGIAHMTNKFFYHSSAARDYGLTVGTRDTPSIELTELGRAVVYADNADIQRQKKIEAFFKVEKFKQVYDHYNGSDLPEEQYVSNTLENKFQIPPAQHAEFVEVFKANCKHLTIEAGLKGLPRPSPDVSMSSVDIRVLGQPQGKFDKTAFVIMPFIEKGKQVRSGGFFDEVLKSLITPAGNAAGFGVITARREDSDIIHHTIINQLLHAELVIADLTDHNPNVLFELGIRLAKEKPVVLIKSKDTGPIFDVDNMMRVYPYDQNLWSTTVEADVKGLTERINGTWENRETAVSYMQILTTGPQATKM